MECCVATTATDIVLASVIKGVLETAGIDAVLSGTDMGAVYPGTSMATISVLVREEDLVRARDVLAQFENGALDDEDEEA
jgi:hypothetical protein